MTPEERSLLERTYKMAEENNEILRGIRSSNRWSATLRIIYWLVLIGASIGAYYYLQPYLVNAISLFNQSQSIINDAKSNLPDNSQLNNFLKQVNSRSQ